MRTSKLILAAGFGIFFIALLAAGQGQDVEGSKDHPLISRYPGSWIAGYAYREYDEYLFPTGKVQDDKPASSQNLEGKVTRITYLIPNGRSTLEVMRNFQSALTQAGFKTLFSCKEEECGFGEVKQSVNGEGTMNYWHTEPGMVQRQLSAKLSRPAGDVYVSVHLTNGDPNPSAQLDIIEMKPMEAGLVTVNAESLAGDIARTGHASVYGIYFDTGKAEVKPESEATLIEIVKVLQQDLKLKLYVVGHTDNQGALEMNMDLSLRRANSVVQALTGKHGVLATRLKPLGDGPSAPVASNDSEEGRAKNRRVELVKQ